MRTNSSRLSLILLLLAGLVIGGFIGDWLSSYPTFSFLNYGQTFGLTSPFVLDLSVLVVTFGFTVKFNLASIIGILIAFIVYRKL
ncbi:MAG: DUF4321 domain-containing protein [Clostridiales bacterium]|nr:DUF4321 domain-containing protein [Clostridiales bacterium]